MHTQNECRYTNTHRPCAKLAPSLIQIIDAGHDQTGEYEKNGLQNSTDAIESEEAIKNFDFEQRQMFKLLEMMTKSTLRREKSNSVERNNVLRQSEAANMPPPTKFNRRRSVVGLL